ncbi:flagellar biosynthetic protein FliO [Virgibacillus sediminis]|uniref:Flagellar biosynthetic protein FliO n=1 Tax=Virgibacillus sediminis TaxID=202260 RepID=A0ABV7AAW1_9BACI
MNQTVFVLKICLAIAFISILTDSEVSAAAGNVLDCLENQQDCEEQLEQPSEEGPTGDEETFTRNSGSIVLDLIKMAFALLLVLGLIYLSLRFLSRKNKLGSRLRALENLGGISVGQNKSIQIVRLGSKVYLVGVGDNVELLGEVQDESVIQEIVSSREDEGKPMDLPRLPSFLREMNSGKREHTSQTPFKHLFTTELDKLKENRKEIIRKRMGREDSNE